jgi:hypothetical protein
MADGPTKTVFSTMRKQAVSCSTVFFSKSCLLHACYLLVEPLKKGVFWSGGFWSGKSLPKWQTVKQAEGSRMTCSQADKSERANLRLITRQRGCCRVKLFFNKELLLA